ncbi:MAG: DUF3048 domain-containing protein [Bacillota bacterium]
MKVLCEPKAPRVSRNPLILVIALIFLTAVMATLLPACGGQNREASEPTVSQDPKTPPAEDPSEPAHPSEPPLDPSPLTGQPMVSPGSPVAVAIDNNPDARPQTGLTEADIVYEVPAEGGITRFLALFHSRSPEVGRDRCAAPGPTLPFWPRSGEPCSAIVGVTPSSTAT